jgi:hypothetical protein
VSDASAARWVAGAWTLLAASSALYFLGDNEADNDLWVHVFSGRQILSHGAVPRIDDLSYTAAGRPWVDHEWLAQTAFAALFDALGPTGLWLCKLAVALLTAGLIWRSVARRSRSAWIRGPVLVLVFATLARGYAIRPQIVTYLGVALLLTWLDPLDESRRRPANWSTVALVAVGFALWANLHAGVIVGLGILALFAAVPWWGVDRLSARDSPFPPRLRLAVLAAAVLAVCINPYGPSLFAYIAGELVAPHPLTEWQPVHPGDAAHAPFLLLLAGTIATVPFARLLRQRPWRAALVAIVAAMAVRHQRHIPLFALCAAAPLAEQAEGALAWLRARSAFHLSATATAAVTVALIGLALVQTALLSARVWDARGAVVYSAGEYPVGALRYLRAEKMRGNLALPLDWGGYALWHAAPAIRVSLDGRFATVYPPAVVEDNFAFFRGDGSPRAGRLLDAYDTTLALVPRGVATPLDGRAGWQRVYTDSVATLFSKTGAPDGAVQNAPNGRLPFP